MDETERDYIPTEGEIRHECYAAGGRDYSVMCTWNITVQKHFKVTELNEVHAIDTARILLSQELPWPGVIVHSEENKVL